MQRRPLSVCKGIDKGWEEGGFQTINFPETSAELVANPWQGSGKDYESIPSTSSGSRPRARGSSGALLFPRIFSCQG